jgi:protein-disulfide isomerase
MNLFALVALILTQAYLWIFATPAFANGDRPSLGPDSAQHTIVMYADYQCPYSQRGWQTLQSLQAEYEGRLRLEIRQYPLDFHPQAEPAARAALCANDQGKFEGMHTRLYEINRNIKDDTFKKVAVELGLNQGDFDNCMASEATKKKVREDLAEGVAKKVNGTPGFFVNGKFLGGAYPAEEFRKILNER